MKKLLLLSCLILVLTLTFGCTSTLENTNTAKESNETPTFETFSSIDGECTVQYDSNLWRLDEEKSAIFFKGKNSYIQLKDYDEKLSEKNYINLLIEEYKKHAIDGTITSTKQKFGDKEYPLIHMEEDEKNYILSRDTLIVMNGEKQYEFVFTSTKDDYTVTKDEAYKVLETVKLLNPSNVIYDDEMAQAFKDLDNLAGIDKESVVENISSDGKELVGSWGVKTDDGKISLRFILTSDNKYSWYKSFPDEDNLLTGEWSYPEPRVLKFKLTKAFIDGKDATSELDPNLTYEILTFKDNTMKMICLENLNQQTYYKIVDK